MNRHGYPSPATNSVRLFLLFGFAAPFLTFIIAVSGFTGESKIILLAAVSAAYTGLYFAARTFWKAPPAVLADAPIGTAAGEHTAEHHFDRLNALEDASEFFGAALKQADMFRLVASRVNEIFQIESALLFRPDAETGKLIPCEEYGTANILIPGAGIEWERSIASIAYLSGEIEIDPKLEIERSAVGALIDNNVRSAAALPLMDGDRVLAVLEIFTKQQIEMRSGTSEILEAIRSRIAPLLIGSFAAEQSIANAFTDPVTNLPNERALYMVLENQLAESIRYRDERPLSVLAVDIKNFRVVNQKFGHSTGDQILEIVGSRIRRQLRKMDLLARFEDDEFVIALPIVDEKAVSEVIARLQSAFAESNCQAGEHSIPVDLNFGSATFWRDGETPLQLVRHAQLRKQQAKAEGPGNVAWFRKEYVN